MQSGAEFGVGMLVVHRRFGYRGVVVDVDASFQLSEQWYEHVARSRPPRDEPWYHVLVDDADHVTYVAERHLQRDDSGEPIRHPLLPDFFSAFRAGRYVSQQNVN
jgi:heat shock protein HspQ